MLTELFTWLTNAVQGSPAIAISAAFFWGILSILLSPCHLSSIPLIIGFIDKQGRVSFRRAFSLSLMFAIGILITIAAIGLIVLVAMTVQEAAASIDLVSTKLGAANIIIEQRQAKKQELADNIAALEEKLAAMQSSRNVFANALNSIDTQGDIINGVFYA